nr:retrotransposon protein, putative, unclassified [Tanacetum cinerariifolium]
MDVKSAFLYGTIEEEVYICQPLGFEDPDYPNKVYKVVKTPSGLREKVQNEANRAEGPNVAPVARECTFTDFMKCGPITFCRNKGAVGGHFRSCDQENMGIDEGNQSNPSAGVQEQFAIEKVGEESDQQYVLFPVWSSGSTNPQNTDEDVVFDEKEPEFEGRKP